MKKTLLTILAAMTLAGIHAQAEDRIEKPLWQCALSFQANGGGLQVIVGKFKLSGPGKISCVDIAGNKQDLDVRVSMGGSPISANIGFGKFQLAGVATGIGVATRPEALLGKYYTLGAQAALLVGAGANFSVHGGAEAATLNIGVSLAKGTGLQLGINRFMIEAAE